MLEDLQNALRMPDGASEMTRNLASLDFPQLTSTLLYRDHDRDSGLSVNRSTAGSLLCTKPLIGANEQIVYVLEDSIKSKLPCKAPISSRLASSKLIGDQLDRGLFEFRWRGKHADRSNRITRAYYQRATQQQFNNPTGLSLILRDYHLYISYRVEAKKRTAAVMTEVAHTLKMLRSSLNAAEIYTQAAGDQELATLVHGMLNVRHDQLYPDEVRVGKSDELHQRCVNQRIGIDVRPDDVLISLAGRQGSATSTRAMNFILENSLDMFMLWMRGDNSFNLLSPDLTIANPFVTTTVMEAGDQVATQGEVTRKYLDREKKANSPYATLFPSVVEQAKEWKEIREHSNSNQTCIAHYCHNVITFCPDTDEDALVCEQQVINTFKKNGIDLFSSAYMQFRNWTAMTPFIHAEGLWEDIKMGGAICRTESTQAVNLLPVVVDNRLCQGGLLTPSYRNQLAFLGIYGDGMGNANYNMAVTGTSGADKTDLVQPILRSVLDLGGIAWMFDMGDGYRLFCESVGGMYLDGKSLKFNPFASIFSINEFGKRIHDQLAVLASPNGMLDEAHYSLLLRGAQEVWGAHREKARTDHVVQKLTIIREGDKYQNSPGTTNRLDGIIELLGRYCSWGIYDEYSNSDEPSLTGDARFIVLELGGLQDKPDLLVAVMFSLIIYTEDKMYRTPCSLKKCCAIDEGWKLLNFKNEKAGQLIETGYHTVHRHRDALTTISQNTKDFDANDVPGAAKVAWGGSAFKVILKQDAFEPKQYNQNRPDQFNELGRSVIGKFGDAKDQWFFSLMLCINDTCSLHRLSVDPPSRAMLSSKGDDFEFTRQCREQSMDIHNAVYQSAQRDFPDEMRELEALAEVAQPLTKNLFLLSLNPLSPPTMSGGG